jgi:hypothetical protein
MTILLCKDELTLVLSTMAVQDLVKQIQTFLGSEEWSPFDHV